MPLHSLKCLKIATGNWSPAPHLNLDAMLESETSRREFSAKLANYDLSISALNCSGNPLHPGKDGLRQHWVTLKTFKLARVLDVDRIVMMSGLPGGPAPPLPTQIKARTDGEGL